MQPSYEISVGRRVVCLPLTKEREKERERFFFFFYWEWLNFTGRGDGERWFRFIIMGNENRARRENRGYHGRRGTNDTITIIILFIIPERETSLLVSSPSPISLHFSDANEKTTGSTNGLAKFWFPIFLISL